MQPLGELESAGVPSSGWSFGSHWDTKLPNNAFVRRQLEGGESLEGCVSSCT